jgi:hypothetical protein
VPGDFVRFLLDLLDHHDLEELVDLFCMENRLTANQRAELGDWLYNIGAIK